MDNEFISHYCHPDPTEYERNATTKIEVEPNGKIHHYHWNGHKWVNTHVSHPGDRERITAKTDNYWALIQRGLGKRDGEKYIADGVKKIDRKLSVGGGDEA